MAYKQVESRARRGLFQCRANSYGRIRATGNSFVPVYLDTQYVGGTEGNTFLSFPVPAGTAEL